MKPEPHDFHRAFLCVSARVVVVVVALFQGLKQKQGIR